VRKKEVRETQYLFLPSAVPSVLTCGGNRFPTQLHHAPPGGYGSNEDRSVGRASSCMIFPVQHDAPVTNRLSTHAKPKKSCLGLQDGLLYPDRPCFLRRCFTSVLYPRSIRARALMGPATIRFRVLAIEPWAVRSSKLSSPVHTGIVCPQSPSARAPESSGRTPCPRYAQQDLRPAISIPARWVQYRRRRFAGAH
jgi:hypothetical protein